MERISLRGLVDIVGRCDVGCHTEESKGLEFRREARTRNIHQDILDMPMTFKATRVNEITM